MVTIDGMSFRPGAPLPTVTFGGRRAAVDPSSTDTQILCITPSATGSGPVDLEITTSGGSMCQVIAGYTYDTVGMLDLSFSGNHFVVHDNAAGGNSNDGGGKIVVDPSGRILVAGNSYNAGGNFDKVIWA